MAMVEQDDSVGGRLKSGPAGWWEKSRRFLSEVKNETGRVTWPSRKEVYATTIVVILTSIFFGVYLGLIDFVLGKAVAWLYTTLGAA
jgi:preprotein translocase subunit SecE